MKCFAACVATVIALTGASSAHAYCPPPDASPNMWASVTRESYAACLRREREAAVRDPHAAIRNRAFADSINRGVIALGLKPLERFGLGRISQWSQDIYNSDLYSQEVREGIRRRFDTFSQAYSAVTASPTVNPEQTQELLRSWRELRNQLVAMRADTRIPAEQQLIDGVILEGDVLSDNLAIVMLARNPQLSPEQVRRIVQEELRLSNAELQAKIEGYLQEMVDIAARGEGQSAAGSAELNARRIAEYTQLGQSLIGVARLAGIFTPEEAATASRVVDGVSQISTAVAIFQDTATGTAAGASVAGPYGMAIAGTLTLISAFERQGPSEGQQIMKMLRALARQIEHLQFTVERGFADLSSQISETELRIMGRLSQLLQNDEIILGEMAAFRSDLQGLQNELLQVRHSEHLATLAAFENRIRYEDGRCLRRFGIFESSVKNACIEYYEQIFADFINTHNARFTGAVDRTVAAQLGYEDRTYLLFEEYNRVAEEPMTAAPVHRPTLEMIAGRVRLMGAYNDPILGNRRMRTLLSRIAAAEQRNEAFLATLTSPGTARMLRESYRKELERVLAAMESRRRYYSNTSVATRADEIYEREVAAFHQPSALHRRADEWTPTTANRIYRHLSGDPAEIDLLAPIEGAQSYLPHTTLQNRLRNFSAAALTRVPVEDRVFPDGLRGNFWISPCNEQRGYPDIPVSKRGLAEAVPSDLIALSSISRDALTICYDPIVRKHRDNVAIGNTETGMDVVTERLRSLGIPPGMICGFNVDFGQYFGQTYALHPEYHASDFEKCHQGDHFHHQMQIATNQIYGVTVRINFAVAGYRPPSASFTGTASYQNGQLDKCFLAYDRHGNENLYSVLLPFRQLYPLPVTSPCASIESQIMKAVASAGSGLDSFLDDNTTVFSEPGAPTVTYRRAVQEVVREASDRAVREYVNALLPRPGDAGRLDALSFLLGGAEHFGAPIGTPTQRFLHMSGAEIRDFLIMRIADRETNTLRDLSILIPAAELTEQLAP